MDYSDINERFRDLFENSSELIHFLTPNGIIEFVNPAWKKALGYTDSEIKGRSIFDFIHPDNLDHYRLCRERAFKDIEQAAQVIFVSKSGKPIVTEGKIGCFYLDDQIVSTRGIFRDITAKKEVEKNLEFSEKRFRSFFQNAPEAVVVINQHDKILEWNPKAEFLFGYLKEEVLGNTLNELIIPEQYREAHKRGMKHFLKTGEGPVLNRTIEISALHKNGNEFQIDLSISSAYIHDEWIFIAFISDITDEKKVEEELITQKAELLHSKYLEEKKDEFIGIASHELKTPLTSIKAFTQLALSMASEGCSQNIKQYLERIDFQAGRLNELIMELLDVSKIQAGKLDLNYDVVNFSEFLRSAVDTIQHVVPTHVIQSEGSVNVNVMIDQAKIEQVLANVINNAVKYSAGANKIEVNSFVKDNYIIVSVSDYGIGISDKDLPHIFGRFFRVKNISSKYSGLGMGLYISSEIIKQHNGEMWVKSEEGKGSTFFFSIPLMHNS